VVQSCNLGGFNDGDIILFWLIISLVTEANCNPSAKGLNSTSDVYDTAALLPFFL
jgi:hypothetical protein